MSKQFFERIDFSGEIDEISKLVCERYNLGKLKKSELILFGYEDFNFKLETSEGKYLVKVFGKFRSMADCQRYINVMEKMVDANVSTPALLKSKEGFLLICTLEGKQLRLCVTRFIEGKNLFQVGKPLNEKEIRFLAGEIAKINQIDYKPPFIYDSWAATNFFKEYKEKGDKLDSEDKTLLESFFKKFKDLKIETLPHSFVHGDIIPPNVIKDKDDTLWIIDFSCSNYFPRIQDLAVLAYGLLLNDDEEISKRNLKIALEEYQKFVKLTPKEIAAFTMYVKLVCAINTLRPYYEKVVNHNTAKENEYFLYIGRRGLKQNISY